MVWKLTATNRIRAGCRVLLLLWGRGRPVIKRMPYFEKRFDTVEGKMWNWGRWPSGWTRNKFSKTRWPSWNSGCFNSVQGSTTPPADSCVMKWGIQSPAHKPWTSWCSLALRKVGNIVELMYVCCPVQCATQNHSLDLFTAVLACGFPFLWCVPLVQIKVRNEHASK